jgi:thiol-disulfide isomerase/thioredoxin
MRFSILRYYLVLAAAALSAAWPCAAPAKPQAEPLSFKLPEIVSGKTFTQAQLSDGIPLVVHVWAPDCPHCIRHMPYTLALYKKLDLDAVNFVTISMSKEKQPVLDFIKEKDLPFPVLYEGSGELGPKYGDDGWPTTYVFAAGGKLVGICDTQGPSYITEVQDLVKRAAR